MYRVSGSAVIKNINPSQDEDVIHLRLVADKSPTPLFLYQKEEVGTFQVVVPMSMMPKNATWNTRVEFEGIGYVTRHTWHDKANDRKKDIENPRVLITSIKVVAS